MKRNTMACKIVRSSSRRSSRKQAWYRTRLEAHDDAEDMKGYPWRKSWRAAPGPGREKKLLSSSHVRLGQPKTTLNYLPYGAI